MLYTEDFSMRHYVGFRKSGHNCPQPDVKSHREIRLKLLDKLFQPVLDLYASTESICWGRILSTRVLSMEDFVFAV